MEAETAPSGLGNASLSWRDLRITHVILPVKDIQSSGISKEALKIQRYSHLVGRVSPYGSKVIVP